MLKTAWAPKQAHHYHRSPCSGISPLPQIQYTYSWNHRAENFAKTEAKTSCPVVCITQGSTGTASALCFVISWSFTQSIPTDRGSTGCLPWCLCSNKIHFFKSCQYIYTDKICFLFRDPAYMMSLPQRVTLEQVHLWLQQTAFMCLEKVSFFVQWAIGVFVIQHQTPRDKMLFSVCTNK